MRTVRIYQDTDLATDRLIELSKEASHHLKHVLRFNNDDSLNLFNGQGGEYAATLVFKGKKVFAQIGDHLDINRESSLHITLLQGVSKGERMDVSIQKAVELGVNRIIPVICQRTVVNLKAERLEKKLRHWKGIIINACEQSGRTRIPELLAPIKSTELQRLDLSGIKLTLDPVAKAGLHSLSPDQNSASLLIGPEGGLTDEEINHARSIGFEGIQMGPRILRTETAAISGITALQTLWGDFKS